MILSKGCVLTLIQYFLLDHHDACSEIFVVSMITKLIGNIGLLLKCGFGRLAHGSADFMDSTDIVDSGVSAHFFFDSVLFQFILLLKAMLFSVPGVTFAGNICCSQHCLKT